MTLGMNDDCAAILCFWVFLHLIEGIFMTGQHQIDRGVTIAVSVHLHIVLVAEQHKLFDFLRGQC